MLFVPQSVKRRLQGNHGPQQTRSSQETLTTSTTSQTAHKGVKKLPPPPQKKRVVVLGRHPKGNPKFAPSAQINKVRTYEAVQRLKRQAAHGYKRKKAAGTNAGEQEQTAGDALPKARRFKRGSNTLYNSI